jgi:hypothetical protein
MKERFDVDALDPDDPFEIDDDNMPHLAKHAPFTSEDVLDAWRSATRCSIQPLTTDRRTG